MQSWLNGFVKVSILLAIICCASASMEDESHSLVMPNNFYGRDLDNDLLVKLLLTMPQRLCHPKRNSDIINSLLGLPKNMNNAGK
ncbi:pigment-dispersing hormone peptides-like [Copidosoma floridanum]|uniref:pigment-dispersing hormone peptides-like n=1 Tax=Copidosoma floridanum TaxID=29053 RepID=UPI0006C98D55|nr:pigment-dispersing hormone peptides-like [Copidosoma floridanum]